MILPTSASVLRISVSPTSPALPVTVDYQDRAGDRIAWNSVLGSVGTANFELNGALSVQRAVAFLSLLNNSGVTVTVTVARTSGSGATNVYAVSLANGSLLQYTMSAGFTVLDSSGKVLTAVDSVNPSGLAGGDLTGSYPSPTLATSGVTAATYGSSSTVAVVALDAKGRATTASSVAIRAATTSVTGIAELATDGEQAANVVVQGNDGRLPGTVASVSPTSPNRTISVVIGAVTYYLHAKTTND